VVDGVVCSLLGDVPFQTLLVRVVDGVVCSLLVRSAFSDPAGEGGRRGCLRSPGEKCPFRPCW